MTDNQKHVSATKRSLVLVGIISLACVGGLFLLSKFLKPAVSTPGGEADIPIIVNAVGGNDQTEKYSINIELSEGQSQPQTVDLQTPAIGDPLSQEEIDLILSRLPALTPAPDEQVDFNLPQEALPPPRPGEIIKVTFPSFETEPTPGALDSGPLQVLRVSPEGEIPIAPFISVTFNQAMIPLGTLGDLAAKDAPIQIEPSLPGTWRWIGTKTLTFEY